jgi:hypothetical protein
MVAGSVRVMAILVLVFGVCHIVSRAFVVAGPVTGEHLMNVRLIAMIIREYPRVSAVIDQLDNSHFA